MKFNKNIIVTLMTGSVLTLGMTQAQAISVTGTAENFPATATITNSLGTNAIGTTLNNSFGHIVSPGQTYHDYTTVKSWADMSIALGWMHSVDWVQVNIPTSGTYTIKDEVIGLRNVNNTWVNQDKNIHPAFTVWTLPNGSFTSSGSSNNATTTQSSLAYGYTTGGNNNTMGFNQVATPTVTNNSKFLLAGGVGDVVGYSNSGVSGWYNGNGDLVGTGSSGSFSGTNAEGFMYTGLTADFAVGSYLVAIGGSCVDVTDCGPVTSINATTGVKSWGTGWHALTVTAVPEPEEWAMMMAGMPLMCWIARRKQASKKYVLV